MSGYSISPKIRINANTREVWKLLIENFKEWWLSSNSEHEGMEIFSQYQQLGQGTKIKIRERIAGILGEATGSITEFIPEKKITWEAKAARYVFLGIPLTIEEGVTWELHAESTHTTELSAHIWASFPQTFYGGLMWFVFKYVLNGIQKDYRHAEHELVYIKQAVEDILT